MRGSTQCSGPMSRCKSRPTSEPCLPAQIDSLPRNGRLSCENNFLQLTGTLFFELPKVTRFCNAWHSRSNVRVKSQDISKTCGCQSEGCEKKIISIISLNNCRMKERRAGFFCGELCFPRWMLTRLAIHAESVTYPPPPLKYQYHCRTTNPWSEPAGRR